MKRESSLDPQEVSVKNPDLSISYAVPLGDKACLCHVNDSVIYRKRIASVPFLSVSRFNQKSLLVAEETLFIY